MMSFDLTVFQSSQYSNNPSIQSLVSSAKNDDLSAICELAHLVYEGEDASRDYTIAADLWEYAAQKGNYTALLGLADCYFTGNGRPEDEARAFKMFSQVYNDHPEMLHALCQIGRMYVHAWGVPRDITKGLEVLNRAWKAGHSRAATEIGCTYLYNLERTVENVVTAIKWFQRASDMGDPKGCYQLGSIYFNGDYGAQKSNSLAFNLLMKGRHYSDALSLLLTSECCEVGTKEDVNSVVEEAIRRAQYGDADLQSDVGYAYAKGKSLPHDVAQAELWYRLAVKNGNAHAAFRLGSSYLYGFDGFEKNIKNALEYLTYAAEHGQAYAMSTLGDLYDDLYDHDFYEIPYSDAKELALHWWSAAADAGESGCASKAASQYERDGKLDLALKYYLIAAKEEYTSCYMPIARMYLYGRGCKPDYKAAVEYFSKAVMDSAGAFYKGEVEFHYGEMYENGWGYPQDYDQAVKHYSAAAEAGYAEAKDALSHFKKGFFGWKKI